MANKATTSHRRNQRPSSAARPSRSLSEGVSGHLDTCCDSLRRLLLTPFGTTMTILVIAIALLLPALLKQLENNLGAIAESFQDSARIILFLDTELTEVMGRRLSEDLLNRFPIESAGYLSQAAALDEFRANSGFGNVIDGLEENPLPASITVVPQSRSAPDIDSLATSLQALEEVQALRVDLAWIQRLAALREFISQLGRLLAFLLSAAVLLIVGNTIRMSIEHRSREIDVVKLVGGTASYIARPFLYSGLILGLAGGLLAALLLLAIQMIMSGPIDNLLSLYGAGFVIEYSGIMDLMRSTLLGGAMGWLGALVSVLMRLYSSPP